MNYIIALNNEKMDHCRLNIEFRVWILSYDVIGIFNCLGKLNKRFGETSKWLLKTQNFFNNPSSFFIFIFSFIIPPPLLQYFISPNHRKKNSNSKYKDAKFCRTKKVVINSKQIFMFRPKIWIRMRHGTERKFVFFFFLYFEKLSWKSNANPLVLRPKPTIFPTFSYYNIIIL